MNKYIDILKRYTASALTLLAKYTFIIFMLVFACLAGFLVIRIGQLSKLEPTAEQISQKASETKSITTDPQSIQKLKELEGRNISIESLFDNGRTNPFEN